MKKLILLTAVIASLSSCETKNVDISSTDTSISGREIKIYTFDSCEYVGFVIGSQYDFWAHKGNCKFCKERNKTQQP
jgi:hypothetical protein